MHSLQLLLRPSLSPNARIRSLSAHASSASAAMPSPTVPSLVTPAWLSSQLRNRMLKNLVVLDASWHMPGSGRDGGAEFATKRLPGARRFDLDMVKTASTLPHMLPSAEDFAAACVALGIDAQTHVVVYDSLGIFSAPRAWFTFKVFGHARVSVLDGGLPAWEAETKGWLETNPPPPVAARSTPYVATLDAARAFTLQQVQTHCVQSREHQLVDARPAARFTGEAPEPRPGLRAGHAPGARSLPFGSVLSEGRMRPEPELRSAFEAAGVSFGEGHAPIVASCGTGVTACVLLLALSVLGEEHCILYDGSWTEWGDPAADTVVLTGPADPIGA